MSYAKPYSTHSSYVYKTFLEIFAICQLMMVMCYQLTLRIIIIKTNNKNITEKHTVQKRLQDIL